MLAFPENKCPFNTLPYAAGLAHVGAAEAHASGRLVILRRAIPGTGLSDGISPWPYLWIGGQSEIEALHHDFRHLVTLTILCQPGYRPSGCDATLLKHHFVYDPALPEPPLSRRAQARLDGCARTACFELVVDPAERLAIVALYAALKERRGLGGGLFDMDLSHFAAIAALDQSVFFRVRSGERIGAMACGVVFADMLQILHIVPSSDGLQWNASYLLMHALQNHVRTHNLKLFTGGMPDGGGIGLRVFKSRWANRMEPVHMIRIVNDHQAYAELCSGKSGTQGYFPAYRSPA
ncbi:hypothetical protein [Roseixanthobacter pseudopolyaromaticivorans]|uniref:hypothetical protein n=1 Tax=Xanthobacteraceae TaxID=335928 RepID=UPI00372803A9